MAVCTFQVASPITLIFSLFHLFSYRFDGKKILAKWLNARQAPIVNPLCVQVDGETDVVSLPYQAGNEWLSTMKLVTKPDQLIKRRGKAGLVGLNLDYEGATAWIKQRMDTHVTVGKIAGTLDTFIIEPFLPHKQEQEFYICMYTTRDGDDILFHHEGGVDIGDVDAKATKITVPVLGDFTPELMETLIANAPAKAQSALRSFIAHLYNAFKELHFAYLEINPLVAVTAADGVTALIPNGAEAKGDDIVGFAVLDLAAKLDETAQFEVSKHWGEVEFPAPFGQVCTNCRHPTPTIFTPVIFTNHLVFSPPPSHPFPHLHYSLSSLDPGHPLPRRTAHPRARRQDRRIHEAHRAQPPRPHLAHDGRRRCQRHHERHCG